MQLYILPECTNCFNETVARWVAATLYIICAWNRSQKSDTGA